MTKRKNQKSESDIPIWKRSDKDRQLQLMRQSKMNEYLESVRHSVNLSAWDSNTPCPVCGTITDELKNMTIHAYFKIRKKRGEENPWVCWICCQRITDPPANYLPSKPKRPRGWQFMSVFVDKDGTVFHKGVEQPELKGTLPPTIIEEDTASSEEDMTSSKKKKRLSRAEKEELRTKALLEINSLKNKIKKGVDESGKKLKKGQLREIEKAIRRQEKFINKLG
jgi:hypothetical protein